jgi:hypothetical protein
MPFTTSGGMITLEGGRLKVRNNGIIESYTLTADSTMSLVTATAKVRWHLDDYISTTAATHWTTSISDIWQVDYQCAGATATIYETFRWVEGTWVTVSPEEKARRRLKDIIKSRCAPVVINSNKKALKTAEDIREERARDTLRRVIGEAKFRDYQRKGFLAVKAKSGLVYQIFPSYTFTNVWNKGNLVEKLCVVLQGNFPPTDSLIMRYLMILNNEEQFRSYAIKHPVYQASRHIQQVDQRSLVEIYAGLKVA